METNETGGNAVHKITVIKNGPYVISGVKDLEMQDGNLKDVANLVSYRLCRCGHSKNKPFCDGSHITTGFDDSK